MMQIHNRARPERKRYSSLFPIILVCVGLRIFQTERAALSPVLREDELLIRQAQTKSKQQHQVKKNPVAASVTKPTVEEDASKGNASYSEQNDDSEVAVETTPSKQVYRLPIPGSPDYVASAPTIVVQLGGNTFNNIAHVARGLGISMMLEREYQVNATLVLKRQKAGVAKEAEQDVKQCFPFMRDFDFGAGMTEEVDQAIVQQKEDPIHKEIDRVINLHNDRTLPLMEKNFPIFLEKYSQGHKSLGAQNGHVNLPLLYAWRLTCSGPLMDKYYDDFRNIFEFDEENCCAATPDPDESVFHFRNYQTEMNGDNGKSGFVELDAERVANQLFAHLKEGDKVAIVSRYETGVQDFIDAFSKRGIVARMVTGQTGMQDFCFLRRAQKEVVGTTRSSFFMYAGFLSRSKIVRAYLASAPDSTWGDMYEWTHPTLKARFRYHSFALSSDEKEQ